MFVASAVKTKGAQFNFTTRFTPQSVERQCSRHKPLQTPTQILHIRERPRELCWKKTVWSAPCLLAEVTLLTSVDRFVIFVRSCHAMLTGPLRQCVSNPRARCVRSDGSMTPRRLHGSCSKPPADVFPFQIFQVFRPLLGWKLKPSIPKHAAAVDLSTAHVTLFWSLPHQSWAADSEPLDHREFAPPTIGPALRHTLRCSGWGCVHLSSRNTWEIVGKVDPVSSYTAGICWKAGCSETKTNPGGTTQEKMSLKRWSERCSSRCYAMLQIAAKDEVSRMKSGGAHQRTAQNEMLPRTVCQSGTCYQLHRLAEQHEATL